MLSADLLHLAVDGVLGFGLGWTMRTVHVLNRVRNIQNGTIRTLLQASQVLDARNRDLLAQQLEQERRIVVLEAGLGRMQDEEMGGTD